VLRQPLVEERVVCIQKIHDAAVYPHARIASFFNLLKNSN